MPSPLFSTYRSGENRVTSSTMAVFERIDLALVQELLESASGIGDELRAVSFENQVVGDGSVPDARISARFTWWFETKTARGGYASEGHDRNQVRLHASQLEGDPDTRLFVLTPDPGQPAWFDELDGVDEVVRGQIIWFSFASLADAIRVLLSDPTRLVSEQTKFLLTELTALYEADGLLSNDDTVVVAAKSAWGEYIKYAAYVCQPDRSFRDGLTHFGFYYQGKIQATVPRILSWTPNIVLSHEAAARSIASGNTTLGSLITQLLADGVRSEGGAHGIMLLSPHGGVDTVQLAGPIENDTKTASGRGWAWTLSQRYTSLERLQGGVVRTSQL
ncbi:hypothetical protein EV644_1456 [Kribbella orskensis]|uniref:Restriction endonuclease n=1 Tax=Kribbella orskensis TaxID=2512216 RepID=A0ABY2B685_9ACTN|nr:MULTISPECIES: hypothetical protein [Kribbella]TCN28592.1 hypothetical protein EV642_1486 [Kribbella sp. VKM Ac-2500]TCO08540.1 hypothetical protein EV644_1456 [Kribbella orskensis]